MRFLADENVSGLIVERLRAAGFEIESVAETEPGARDERVIEAAGDRIVITEDQDFGELVIRQRLAVRGVVLLELDRLSNEAEADRVVECVLAHSERLPENLVVVEPTRIRVRPLAG